METTDKKIWIVLSSEPNAEDVSSSLGISTERLFELAKIIAKAMVHSNTVTEAMVLAQESLTNINELAFVCFHIGILAEQQRKSLTMMSKLSDLFSSLDK